MHSSFFVETDGDGVVAAVDVGDLAGDRARQLGEVERGDVADFVDGDVALQWRRALEAVQELGKAADARRCKRLDRSGGQSVDADALGTKARGEIADVGFEARFGKSHHV